MKRLFASLAVALLFSTQVLAQWQVPAHSVPVGRGGGSSGFRSAVPGATALPLVSNGASLDPSFRMLPAAGGGTGTDNSTAATNDTLTWTGSGFVSRAWTTVVNTACTLAPTPCALLFGYYAVEWFGAVATPGLPAAGNVANSQTQIQAAVTAATTAGGGVVKFSRGVYGIGDGVTAGSQIIFKGSGVGVTRLLLQPTIATSAIAFGDGSNIVYYCGVRDLSIQTVDTTRTKIGINMFDVSSCTVDNVLISGYPSGYWTATASTAVGINIHGRELSVFNNVTSGANIPIQISVNSNAPGTGEDLDSFVFRDMYLVGEIPGITKPLIQVDDAVSIYNSHFTGHQNWVGGFNGFSWNNSTGAVISEGVYISGVKDEQSASTGRVISIQTTPSLYNLNVSKSAFGGRNGLFLRGVQNTLLESIMYDANTSTTKNAMDADLTNGVIDFRSCAWITGTLATMGAFTPSGVIVRTGFSSALPTSGVLYQ